MATYMSIENGETQDYAVRGAYTYISKGSAVGVIYENEPEQTFKESVESETAIHPNNVKMTAAGETVVQDNVENLSPEMLLSAMQGGNKITSSDLLDNMTNSKGNIHMKTDIVSPEAYTLMHVIADWLIETQDFVAAGRFDKSIAVYGEQLVVSRRTKKGNRAERVMKAIESVMKQDFEKDKMKSRMLGGGSQ
jgi:hypothetical protein